MKRIVVLLAAAVTLTLGSPASGAAETQVYVSIGVGGAVVVGGGLLLWGLTYTSQISRRDTEPNVMSSFLSSIDDSFENRPRIMTDGHLSFTLDRGSFKGENLLRLPLFIYRW